MNLVDLIPLDYIRKILESILSFSKRPQKKYSLPYTSYEDAVTRAQERRMRIQSQIENLEELEVLNSEFIEEPPEFISDIQPQFYENIDEVFGEMARLRWQLASDELLLIERLIDVIIILLRDKNFQVDDVPLVKLEPIKENVE